MALAIARAFRQLQATKIVHETLISRFRLNGAQVPEGWIKQDVETDLDPQSPFGLALDLFAHELESANPREVLGLLYRQLLEPQ